MTTRRELIRLFAAGICGAVLPQLVMAKHEEQSFSGLSQSKSHNKETTLFLCGDVMTGRGIDQILPHPSAPQIYEPYLRNAKSYVRLATELNGPIPAPVGYDYIWGDALKELKKWPPDVRIINLETSITTSEDFWRGKGINYRMHPANIAALTVAGIDCCSLANNHVLDWGYSGLNDTLTTLQAANLGFVGAGQELQQAQQPWIIEISPTNRVILVGLCSRSSGVPAAWAAKTHKAGVYLIDERDLSWIYSLKEQIAALRRNGDILVCSIHWGGNWGYSVAGFQQNLAHRLIDLVGVDIVHGHSSHHAMATEVYQGKPILYGCGDFINDYEGIGGYDEYRSDLRLMYFVSFDRSSGELSRVRLVPLQSKQFRLTYAQPTDTKWLQQTLNREGLILGTRLELAGNNQLMLRW